MTRNGFVLSTILVLAPLPANAHLVGMEFGEFYAGAMHLLVTPAHFAFLIALALVAAFQPKTEARWALAALPAGFAVGVVSPVLLSASVSSIALGMSIALVGLMAVFALRLGITATIALTGLIAALHGYTNMLPALGAASLWLYGFGVLIAGTVTGTILIAVFSANFSRTSWMPLAYRVVSGWLVAIGTMYAGLDAAV